MSGREAPTTTTLRRWTGPSTVLFASMFAAQAGFLVLAPILPEVSRELGVTTAATGQLRLASGFAGGATALALAPLAARLDLRGLLTVGLTMIAAGSLASALAPTFALLVIAQLGIGSGLGIVLSATIAAAAEWAPPGQRTPVLSWTLLGQPAAWVVGMPLAGVVADVNWRLAWLTVPLVASLVALAAVRGRPRSAPAVALKTNWRCLSRNRAVAGWALGELLAFAGWSGTLVYCGALLVESYGASPASVGLVLAGSAVAYFPGNFLVRGVVDRAARPLLIGLGVALAVGVAIFGVARPSLAFSTVVFAGLVFLAGGRTLAGSAVGLHSAPEDTLAVTRARAAATQFGYVLGAGAGGGALAVGGYSALGIVLAALFAGAVLPHIAMAFSARWSSADSTADALGLARAR